MTTTYETKREKLTLDDLRQLCVETGGWPADTPVQLYTGFGLGRDWITVSVPTQSNVNCPLSNCK